MLEFKQGFFAEALNNGLPEKQAAHMWKRAMDYPGAESMLKQLDIPDAKVPQALELHPEQLAQLSEIMQQQKVQEEMLKLKNQLGI
jgi:hypothetical protein